MEGLISRAPMPLPLILKQGKLMYIPLNAGLTSAVTGSGAASLQSTMAYRVNTGATASSTARAYGLILHPSTTNSATSAQIHWGKKLYWFFRLSRFGSDTQVVARLQIKTVSTEGVLANEGIGIQIANLAVSGESKGTGNVATVNLSTTMTALQSYAVMVIHNPAVSITWYMDTGSGLVLKGTQSTAANIPATTEGNYNLVTSIINGLTGGTDCGLDISSVFLWQDK